MGQLRLAFRAVRFKHKQPHSSCPLRGADINRAVETPLSAYIKARARGNSRAQQKISEGRSAIGVRLFIPQDPGNAQLPHAENKHTYLCVIFRSAVIMEHVCVGVCILMCR